MPDDDLEEPQSVKLTLHGAVVDVAYSRMLIQKTDLTLADILALDRVQKKLPLDDAALKPLRHAKLIEGRRPNQFVAATVASATAGKADDIRTHAQDDMFYAKLPGGYLANFGAATRQEIDKLGLDKLIEALDSTQKETRISNLLTGLRSAGTIKNVGSRNASKWVLHGKE